MGITKSHPERARVRTPLLYDAQLMNKVQEVNEFCTLLNNLVLNLEHIVHVKQKENVTTDGTQKLSLVLELHISVDSALEKLPLLQLSLARLLKTIPFEIRLRDVHPELLRLDIEKLQKNLFDQAEIAIWKSVNENLIKIVNSFYKVYCPVFNRLD